MSTGFVLNIPQEMLNRLEDADKKIEKLAKTSEDAQTRIVSAFKSINTHGIDAFINKLTEAQTKLSQLGNTQINIGVSATAIDEINGVIRAVERVRTVTGGANMAKNPFVDNGLGASIAKLNEEIERAKKNFAELQNRFTHLSSPAGDKTAVTSIQNEAQFLMEYIRVLGKEKDGLIVAKNALAEANKTLQQKDPFKAKVDNLSRESLEAQRYKDSMQAMKEFYAEQDKEGKKAEADRKKREKEAEADRKKREKEAEADRKKREKEEKATADRIAAYDSKARRERYKAYTTTYEGAMRTSDRAKTLLQEQQAIKNLEAARAKLNKTDSDYANKLRNLNQRILEHKNNIDKTTAGSKNLQKQHRSLMDISGQLARRLALVFSVSQITGYVKKLIEVRGEFELQQRSLQAILQNKDEANRIWQQTVDLAVRSPFRVKELVSYTKQLAAYRIESDKLFETNKMLADISAGLGVDMQRLILAFGQVRSAAYLRGTELRQFTEAGIPILEQLAQYFTELEGRAVSVGDVFERVSKRMVSFADVEEIFRRMTSEGGTFYRMQEIQAETLKGMWSNLKDSIDIMLNEIGKANEGTLKGSIQSVKELVDGWRDLAFAIKLVLVPLGTYLTITGAIKFANTAFSQGLLMMAMNFKTTSNWLIKAEKGIVGLATKMGVGKTAAAGFAKALGGLASLGVAALIAGIVVGLVALITKLTSASRAAKQLNKDLQAIYNEDTSNLKTQVRSFESLVGRLKDVNKGSREHEEIISQLNSQYGEYLGFIVDEKTTYDQLASSIDSVTLALTRKAKMNTFEKAYSKTLESTNKQIAELEDRITKQAFKEGMTLDEGKTPLVPTQEEIDDIFGLIEKKVRETGKTITSYEQLNEIVSEYYDKDVEVAGTAIKNFTDITNYYLQQKEAELELDRKINDVYGDSLRSSAEARQAFADLEERQAKALKDAEKESKWVKEDIRNQFAKEKIDLEVKYEGLDEATAELRKKTLDSMSATIKDVNEKIEGSVVDLGEKYANLIYIDTNEASKSLNEIAESTAASYKAQQDIIKQQNALKDAGTAYDAEILKNAELSAKAYYYKLQLLGRLDLLQKEEKKEEKASVKILQRRINLLKEVNKKYLELAKTFDSQTAEKKIIESYSDTFKEAFEGTGVTLDLYKVMTQSVVDARKIGGEAGSALTEAMLEKLQELEGAGTYIRSFSDDLVEEIKKAEGFRAKAYQDAGGVWTQGYGETQGVEKDKEWTEEFAAQRLRTRLTEDYASAVNKVLDANRDLIITQEQYNALVDLAYQGGGGAVKNLVKYAKDVEQGASYIERISKKIEAAMGEEAAARFGETFVNSFKEAETIQERMAMLLQTMNLTIKGKINKDWYEGMQKRSDKRAAMFSGDLDIANQLETVLVRIAGMDFKTTEGMVEALNQLKVIAEKEGPEAKNILSQTISGLEAEIGLRVKKEADEKLKDDIQELFDRYNLSLELKKLNLPPDIAESLFDIEYLDLKGLKENVINEFSGTSEALKTELQKGFGNIDWLTVKNLSSGELMEAIKKALKDIDDLEEKQQLESAKRFAKFLTQNLDQTKVVLQQRGIDIAFAKKEFDEGRISAEQFAETVKNIVAQSNEEISKFNLEKFKETPEYIQAMGDLASYSKKEIQGLIKTLNDAVTQNAHLFDADEVKAYMDALKKAQEELESRDVFKWGDFGRAADIIQTQKEIEDKKADIETNKAELETQKQKLAELQAKLDNLKAQQKTTQDAGGDTTQVDADIAKTTSDIVTANEEIGKTNNEIKTNTGLLSLLGDKMKGLAGNMGNTLAIIDAIVHGINDTVQGINTIYGEIGSVMESFGKETDFSTGFGKGAVLMDTFAKSSQAAADGWDAFKNGDPVGVVVNVVKSITEIIKGINAYHDAGLEVIIQDHLEEVERLQKEYEKLEWAIDRAFSFKKYGMVAELQDNLAKQIENTQKAIAAEEDKKDTDKDRIEELQGEIEEASKQIQELYDNLRADIVGTFEDLSSTLGDAMISALQQGEDALKAWSDSVNDIITDIVGQLLIQKYLEPQIANLVNDYYSKIMPKNARAENKYQEYLKAIERGDSATAEKLIEEYKKLAEQAIGEVPQINEDATKQFQSDLLAAGENFKDLIPDWLINSTKEGSGLSALSKSIQGVSESTAQVLESLLSSMRFYVADSNAKLTQLLNNMMGGETESPMLAELRAQTKWMRDIYNLINGMTATHPSGGRGIKAVM